MWRRGGVGERFGAGHQPGVNEVMATVFAGLPRGSAVPAHVVELWDRFARLGAERVAAASAAPGAGRIWAATPYHHLPRGRPRPTAGSMSAAARAPMGLLLSQEQRRSLAEEVTMDERFVGRDPSGSAGKSDGGQVELSAPLAGARRGGLELRGGARTVTIRADPALSLRYRARIEGTSPEVATGGDTTVIHLRWPLSNPILEWRQRAVEVALNPSIPWEVRVRGGASALCLDVAAGELKSFELLGGVGDAELVLPHPSGEGVLRLLGGARRVWVRRPAGVPVRLRVHGAGRVELDRQRFGVVAGSMRFEPPPFVATMDRYDLYLVGGVGELIVAVAGQ
jgi:hypothetical protein